MPNGDGRTDSLRESGGGMKKSTEEAKEGDQRKNSHGKQGMPFFLVNSPSGI